MSTKAKVYILIGLIVIAIALTVYIVLAKQKKNANAAQIADAIDKGVGKMGTDIDSLLLNTKIESGYNTPKADLEKLYAAKGTFTDSPGNFVEVFRNKSKARIKKIIADFQKAYGIKLNDYINEVFDNVWGYDSDSYNQLLNTIRSAS